MDSEIITSKYYKPTKGKKTSPFMTKYEYSRLIASRMVQLIGDGEQSKPLIKIEGITDPKKIAQLELSEGVIPLVIQRKLIDGTLETWHVKELNIWPHESS